MLSGSHNGLMGGRGSLISQKQSSELFYCINKVYKYFFFHINRHNYGGPICGARCLIRDLTIETNNHWMEVENNICPVLCSNGLGIYKIVNLTKKI